MENIIETKKLNKSYLVSKDNEQKILKDIDLEIKKGEYVSLMGPSGSGKSTLLYSISGMDPITSGSAKFKGEELADKSEKELTELRLHQMGFVFQNIHLLKNLCILDNIILSAVLGKKSSRKEIVKRALILMEQMGIKDLADRDITQASGGQLQRVGICRALINEPDIIFGDEPTGALNSKSSQEIMAILSDINEKGTTVLLATHDAKVAAKTERILFLLDGKIVDEHYLGKYRKGEGNVKEREVKVSEWLIKMGL